MDTLKEFFAATRERLSSPFFGSFIFAWCVANWKIFIALAFFSREDYASVHTKNALDYIVSYLRKEHHFWWPLFIALTYTFGYPFFKAAIRAVRDYADSLSEKWNLKIAGTSKVDTLKYLEIKESLSIKEKKLQTLIDEENEVRATANSNAKLLESNQAQLASKEKELNRVSELLLEHEHYNPFKQLIGSWVLESGNPSNDSFQRLYWEISDQPSYLISFSEVPFEPAFARYKPNYIVGGYGQKMIGLWLNLIPIEGGSPPPEGITVDNELFVFIKKSIPSGFTVIINNFNETLKMQKIS